MFSAPKRDIPQVPSYYPKLLLVSMKRLVKTFQCLPVACQESPCGPSLTMWFFRLLPPPAIRPPWNCSVTFGGLSRDCKASQNSSVGRGPWSILNGFQSMISIFAYWPLTSRSVLILLSFPPLLMQHIIFALRTMYTYHYGESWYFMQRFALAISFPGYSGSCPIVWCLMVIATETSIS